MSRLDDLTREEIATLVNLTHKYRYECIGRAHENPQDEHYRKELLSIKRIYSVLMMAHREKT